MVRKQKTKEIQIDRTHWFDGNRFNVQDEGILRIVGERNVNQRLTQISRGGDVSLAAEARLTLFEWRQNRFHTTVDLITRARRRVAQTIANPEVLGIVL